MALVLLGAGVAFAEPPSLLVLGLRPELPPSVSAERADLWRDQRLGMGLRGRLVQMCADSGAFTLLEDRELAPSIEEAVGGEWVRERSRDSALDLRQLHADSGAAWIVHAALVDFGVTRDRVRGLVGGRRWRYRVEVRLCLHADSGRELCAEGEGDSVSRVLGAVVEYRGDEVIFDQAGPAQAVDRALADAFNTLMPRWAEAVRAGSPEVAR